MREEDDQNIIKISTFYESSTLLSPLLVPKMPQDKNKLLGVWTNKLGFDTILEHLKSQSNWSEIFTMSTS